jgi:hypothetical protein
VRMQPLSSRRWRLPARTRLCVDSMDDEIFARSGRRNSNECSYQPQRGCIAFGYLPLSAQRSPAFTLWPESSFWQQPTTTPSATFPYLSRRRILPKPLWPASVSCALQLHTQFWPRKPSGISPNSRRCARACNFLYDFG